MCYLAALLLCAVSVVTGCASPMSLSDGANHPATTAGAAGADAILGVVAAPLARVEAGLQGVKDGLAVVQANRDAAGKSQSENIDLNEILLVLGSTIAGMFGVNVIRDRKYAKIPKAQT